MEIFIFVILTACGNMARHLGRVIAGRILPTDGEEEPSA
jgi:hypothetical protein